MLIEHLLEFLCIDSAVIIKDVGISLGNHRCLGVSGISLYRLDITAAQLQFVCSAGMAKTMKHNRLKVAFSDEFIERIPYLTL